GEWRYLTVRLLIDAGADVTIPDGDGTSPRDLADRRGFDDVVALIDAAS
ncbi:ankyrin repeat domain-containing protein, partial [Nocardia cyriacigeorgica]|nr:ankyrin repeat domain-containing protein [Nocardia cyriacigeorgica]